MSEEMTNLVLLGISAWCTWFFGKRILAALQTGALPAPEGATAATTREGRPSAFWLSVGLSTLFVLAFVWLMVSVLGDLAGFWEFKF